MPSHQHKVTHWWLACLCLSPFALGQTTTTITATPAVLTFQYQLSTSTMPPAQKVTLKSSAGTLPVSLSISGDLPSNGNWLTPNYRPGTTFNLPTSLTLTVTPTGLAAGNYSAVVMVTGSTTSGLVTQSISVTLAVLPPPSTLYVNPATLPAFTYTTGGTAPADQSFLPYSTSPMSVTISVKSAPWLKVTPTGTVQVVGLMKPIVVSIDPVELAKLSPKTYTANVTITAPTATNKSMTYPITLVVSAAPPTIAGTWPDGVVMNASGSGTTTVVVNGAHFFSTSTVMATGFDNSTVVKVTDTSTLPLTATETVTIPVYPLAASDVRLLLGSPLPTGFVGATYSQDLSPYVAGGTGPYYWSGSNLPTGFSISPAGLLTCSNPVAGSYTLTLRVTDLTGAQAYMPVTLTVYPAVTPPVGTMWVVVPSVLISGIVGSPYSGTLNVLGGSGTYSWSIDPTTPFPSGISLGTSGDIGGTPTSVGSTGSLTSKLLSDGALQVVIPNSYLTKLGVLRMAVLTPAPGGGASNDAQLIIYGPEPRVLAVGNSASYATGSIAPGELITIFGTGLGPSTMAVYDPNATVLATALPSPAPASGATQVDFIVGTVTYPAALLYTTSGQVGAMVPFEVGTATSVQMVVSYGTLSSKAYPLSVATAVPGIFSLDGSGIGQGAILNYISSTGDYVVNSSANAALKGSIVVLYVTGSGATNPATGSWSLAGQNVDTANPVSVTIDGKSATVVTSVPQGSFPGVLQINATVPSDVSSGKAVPVTVSAGGIPAQSGVTMSVK